MNALDAEELLEKISDLQEKVRTAETQRDEFINRFKEKITRATEICEETTREARLEIASLTELLRRYTADNLPENSKTLKLPSGRLSFRKQPPRFYFDGAEVTATSERLIEFAKTNAPEYVKQKVTETADWSAIKKQLQLDGDKVYFAETGELIDGLQAQILPDKFTVEVG